MKKLLGVVGLLILLAGAGGAAYFLALAKDLPSIEQIRNREVNQSTKIYDRTGEVLLYEMSAGQKRTVVPFEEIPQYLKDASIAIEDERFYEEAGFDWRGILRALVVNLMHGKILQGGSTITQQLARNAFLSSEQTITRKLKEFLLAIYLNRHLTKDQILALYLNEIPYGPTAYGVEAAGQLYFGKHAKDIPLAESALLAALARAPSYYSPWGSHTKELLARKDLVLQKMRDLGKITDAQFREARGVSIAFMPQATTIKAPHFVMAVQDYLVKKYGDDLVRTGGLRVQTTLDWPLQEIAERVIAEGAKRNEDLYQGKNAALVALDAKTGQVLSLVGSRDYFDMEHEGNFNVATQGLRQPGSALKPFAYLTAFGKGFAPQTTLFDVPTEFVSQNTNCPPAPDFESHDPQCFHPQDFDETFRGPVSMAQALAQSINIPAVKTLYLAGLENTLKTLSDFGVTTLTDPRRYGLSLVLGGGEVRLIELAGAYSVLAEDGVRRDPTIILEIKDRNGAILESWNDDGAQVVDAQYPRIINSILSDPTLRAPLFSSSLQLTIFPDHDVALKTGTSNDYRDAWAMGYTPSLVVGVWAGNNDYTPMQRRGSSILAAVPIWHDFMAEALKTRPQESFTRPNPVTPQKPILAGDYLFGDQLHSVLYYLDKDDPEGPPPADPARDPQFSYWEQGVLAWATKNVPNWSDYNRGGLALSPSPGRFILGAPQIYISNPEAGAFVKTTSINLRARITAGAPLTQVSIYLNNQLVGQWNGVLAVPYDVSWSFVPTNLTLQNKLEIEAVTITNLKNRTGVVVYR